jgi:hypothetical protein
LTISICSDNNLAPACPCSGVAGIGDPSPWFKHHAGAKDFCDFASSVFRTIVYHYDLIAVFGVGLVLEGGKARSDNFFFVSCRNYDRKSNFWHMYLKTLIIFLHFVKKPIFFGKPSKPDLKKAFPI